MFRMIAFMLMGLLAFGCAEETIPEESTPVVETEKEVPAAVMGGMMLINPMQKQDSLETVNEIIGCRMQEPAGYAVENASYYVYNVTPKMGQYKFTVDGIEYTLRAAKTTDDISGVYYKGMTLGAYADENAKAEKTTVFLDDGMWTRWFDGEMQYSLWSSQQNAESTEVFFGVRDALMAAE